MITLTGQFIYFCWLVFVGYWLIAAFSVKRTVENRTGLWSFWMAFIVGAGLVIVKKVPVLATVLERPLWPTWFQLGLIADLLALIGLVIMIWARMTIGRNWSGGVVLKEDHELITAGPYAYVRHPIYTGLLMLMLATALFWDALGGFLGLAAFTVLFVIKSRQEEKLMLKTFPDKYPGYMKRVKALIPFVF